MVQNILSAMNSDEVNHWNDSVESRQVAQILQDTYNEIIARADLPEHYRLIDLDDSLDINKPTLMFKPVDIALIKWLDYNINDDPQSTQVNYRRMRFLDIKTFLNRIDQLNEDDPNVGSFIHDGKTYKFNNDRAPTCYTVIQDMNIFFDSYNANVDSTLQASKVRSYGRIVPVYTFFDTFVPNLPDDQFVILLNEAKDRAFQEIKQTANPKSQLEARRGWRTLQRIKEFKKPKALDQFADFGRRRP